MAAYVSAQPGDPNDNATWGGAGHPTSGSDTASVSHVLAASTMPFVCGAMNFSGAGAMDTGAQPYTVTSITQLAGGTGKLTIGPGGIVMGGAINWNQGGDAEVRGPIAGLQTSVLGKAASTSAVTIAEDVAVNMSSTSQNLSLFGIVTLCPGVNIGGIIAPRYFYASDGAGTYRFNGTALKPILIKTDFSPGALMGGIGAGTLIADNTQFLGGVYSIGNKRMLFRDCVFRSRTSGNGFRDQDGGGEPIFVRCLFSSESPGSGIGMFLYKDTTARLFDCAFGRQENGTSAPFQNDVYLSGTAVTGAHVIGKGVHFASAVPLNFGSNAYAMREVMIDDYGFCTRTGGSWPVMTPGIGFHRHDSGSVQRSTANPPSGATFHARLTPAANLWPGRSRELVLSIPVASGDSVAVALKLARSAGLAAGNCARVTVDLENAFGLFATQTPAVDMAYTDVNLTPVGVSTGSGMLRLLVECIEYIAGNCLDVGPVTVMVTHGDGTTSLYVADMSEWANGMPVAEGAPVVPDAPAAPSLMVTDDGTGASVTSTVTGDAGVTHRVYWRRLSSGLWTLGGSREGNGTLAIAGLPSAQVQFLAVSERSGLYSLPSLPVEVAVGERSGSDAVFVAQEVVDLLNGHGFSQPFTAERTMLPERDLSEMTTLRVTVVPREIEVSPLDRVRDARSVAVDVAIQHKPESLGVEDTDALMALVQEVAQFLNRRHLANATWQKTAIKPLCAPDHLREKRLFTSVLTLTYRLVR